MGVGGSLSNSWLTWAFEYEGLKPGEKGVLVALSDHADEDGYCYPSQKRLSLYTGMNTRTIRRHLEALEERGLLSREKETRNNGSYTTDRYFLQRSIQPADNLTAGQEEHLPADNLTGPEPSINPQEINKPRTKTKTSLPDSFPDDHALKLAEAYWKEKGRTDLNAREQGARFRDNCLAHGRKYLDWKAAWRQWYCKAPEYNKAPRNKPVPIKVTRPQGVYIYPDSDEWEAWKEHDKPLKWFERDGQSGSQDWWELSRVLKPSKFPEQERKSA